MQFQILSTYLRENGLRAPDLEVLRQDNSFYSSLLFQPTGTIDWSNEFIRFADQTLATNKFNLFFDLAVEKNVELAITPEYSCPWNVISTLIDSDILPTENKLWVVGCQSIKAEELNTLIEDNENIVWLLERDKLANNINNNRFFDPVCYIFKTKLLNSEEIKTVILIQFKTHPLGGAGLSWERDNFIPGEKIYILENATDSTKLVTFICSDVLSPGFHINNLPAFLNMPYLIIHLQLNQAPNHLSYSRYRSEIYDGGSENKEFICLNWGRNVIIDGTSWNSYGGSALYLKPEKESDVDIEDNKLNVNQKLGLYYTKWSDRYAHVFLFNYNEHIFFLRNTKPSQVQARPPVRKRSGAEMLETRKWNNDIDNWEIQPQVDGGLPEILLELNTGYNYATLTKHYSNKPIDAERLVYLSVGKATYNGWYDPRKNSFFHLKDDEINKRLTFTQDPSAAVREERERYLLQYSTLEYEIITNARHIPSSIKDLKDNCKIDYRLDPYSQELNLNLFPLNPDGVPACGAYIGHSTDDKAQNILNKMTELLKNGQYGKRTVVWYLAPDTQIKKKFNSAKPKFTDNTMNSSRSITSKRK